MGVPGPEQRILRVAALLHDVGKLAVPDRLLSKPGRLSESEIQKMRAHPAAGAALLAPAGLPEPILAIIRHHHEHWDGSGYPAGLKCEAIPRGARILGVADAFEALISDRSYRSRLSPREAVTLMKSWSGIQFDPEVVRVLEEHLEEVLAAAGAEEPASAPEPPSPPPVAWRGAVPAAGPADSGAAQREVFALYEIAQTLGSSLRLDDVLDLVVSRIAQLIPFRTCVVYLPGADGQGLEARFVTGANAAALRGHRLRPGEGISGRAAAHGSRRFAGSAEMDLSGTSVDLAGYSTVAAFPLCGAEQVHGVITLYFPADAVCHEDHARLMEIVARLAAGAVRDGRLAPSGRESELTDAVTHLPTARYLQQLFEQETIRSQQSGQPFALLEMDLDEFRAINDRLGPPVGDRFLMEIGRLLKSHLRERDVLVRRADDEYAALLPGSGFAAAALLSERLQQAVDGFALRLDDKGGTARAGLSVGVAIYPLDGESLDDLMARATLNRIHNKRVRKSVRNAAPNVVRFPGHLT
jgi:diguanylate cyclase (GGDEF)-like protein